MNRWMETLSKSVLAPPWDANTGDSHSWASPHNYVRRGIDDLVGSRNLVTIIIDGGEAQREWK